MENIATHGGTTSSIRKRLYSLLLDPTIEGNYQKGLDWFVAILIVLNLFALALEGVEAVHKPYKSWFEVFEVVSVVIFTIEYLLRWYLAPEGEKYAGKSFPRLRYMRSPFAIIDILAIAPFYLQMFLAVDLRFLRALRLLRILKLFRVLVPAIREFSAANAGRTFRQQVYALIFDSPYGGRLHDYFERFIAFWVLVSVVCIILESVASIHYLFGLQFLVIDIIAVSVFVCEYTLRLYSCVEDPKFSRAVSGRVNQATQFSVVVDFLAIMPYFLEPFLYHIIDLRFLRIFRLIRVLKLARYSTATKTVVRVITREWPVIGAATFVMGLLVILTACLGFLFESDAQPDKFENIPQAIYWAVITLASVGYGDISPITPLGRAMTIVLALLGIGIFAIPAALFASAFSDELSKERAALRKKLMDMLSDGVLDADEEAILYSEAHSLHLSKSEVDEMVEKAHLERATKADTSLMPLMKIAERPDYAIEHFKMLLGQIRQLGILTDDDKFLAAAEKGGRLSATESDLWKRINPQV